MTTHSAAEITIPPELEDALRRTAIDMPGAPPELTEIRRRHRRRQLRASAGALVAVAVLVAASIVAPRLLAGSTPPVESAAPADPTPAASPEPPVPGPPAQRLIVASDSMIIIPADAGDPPDVPDPARPNYGYPAGSIGIVSSGVLEVTPTGDLAPIELAPPGPGEVGIGFLALPDGRVASLSFDSLSDVPRRDGPCITAGAIHLQIYEADGTISVSPNIRVPCESVRLVGASADEVFLIRTPHEPDNQTPIPGRRLVAYRLSDYTERTVANLDSIGDVFDASIGSGAFVARPAGSVDCRVRVIDLATGSVRDVDLAAAIPDCLAVDSARVAPNGARLAVSYTMSSRLEQPYEVGFAVVDIAGPSLRLRETVHTVPPGSPMGPFPGAPATGIAWTDDATVRVAWARYPDDLDRVIALEEILDVQTYNVP